MSFFIMNLDERGQANLGTQFIRTIIILGLYAVLAASPTKTIAAEEKENETNFNKITSIAIKRGSGKIEHFRFPYQVDSVERFENILLISGQKGDMFVDFYPLEMKAGDHLLSITPKIKRSDSWQNSEMHRQLVKSGIDPRERFAKEPESWASGVVTSASEADLGAHGGPLPPPAAEGTENEAGSGG